MGIQFSKTKSQPNMKVLLFVALAIAAVVAEPEAEADAEAGAAYYGGYYGLGGYGGYYGHGYGGYCRAYGYGGHHYGKRSADAEPTADAEAEAGVAHYGAYPYAFGGYYGHGLVA